MRVKLEPYELIQAALVGSHRHVSSIAKGLEDKYGAEKGGWNLHLEGACGELAFAKAADAFWSGSVDTFSKGGDVGKVQIRTRSKPEYDLIVRAKDRDEDLFVLVVGVAPEYEVVGAIRGGDAKQDRWEKSYGGRPSAWFVPKDELLPFDELVARRRA